MILGIQHIIEMDGLKFTVRPETFDDFIAAIGLRDETLDPEVVGLARVGKIMTRRITAWEGPVLPDGTPAPCTEENILILFGAKPDLVGKLATRIAEAEADDLKNFNPSQAG